jgi:hypothetical protein
MGLNDFESEKDKIVREQMEHINDEFDRKMKSYTTAKKM